MLFNSLFFLFVFFPIVTGFYYFIPHKFRWVWLLVASCYFYMSFIPSYLLILALTISIDYVAGRCIERLDGKKKRAFLLLSICSNLGVLFVFKYFDFFNANLDALAQLLHWNYSREALSLILPIGLSFHTFQGLAYIIEVYRGRQRRNALLEYLPCMFSFTRSLLLARSNGRNVCYINSENAITSGLETFSPACDSLFGAYSKGGDRRPDLRIRERDL